MKFLFAEGDYCHNLMTQSLKGQKVADFIENQNLDDFIEDYENEKDANLCLHITEFDVNGTEIGLLIDSIRSRYGDDHKTVWVETETF